MRPGEQVKTYRALSRKTLRQLAGEAGLHYSTLSRIESGEHLPTPGSARALARVMGLKQWWALCEPGTGGRDHG